MQTKTQEIFQLSAPYDNPFQGKDKRVLFICSAGLLRSATAANVFASKGYNTRSAGSAGYALVPLSANLLAWAQLVVFVHPYNQVEALETFKDTDWEQDIRDAIVLNIDDKYEYKATKLIEQLEYQLEGKI